MRTKLKAIVGASALAAGLLAAPVVLYAHDNAGGMMGSGSGNMIGDRSMMGQGSGGMMGSPGGMMNMMNQMSRMAQNRNTMMTGMMSNQGGVPNQQWKQKQPSPQHHDQSE